MDDRENGWFSGNVILWFNRPFFLVKINGFRKIIGMNPASFLLRFALFTVIGLVLRHLTSNAPTPENAKNLWYAAPAFLVFLLFWTGLLSWGAFFRQRFKIFGLSSLESTLLDLVTGSLFAYLLAYLLTPLHLFSANRGWALWLVLGCGYALGFGSIGLKKAFDFGSNWYSKLFMGLVPLIVSVKLIEGIQFHQHGDSYVTYLVGPRAWGESGSFGSFLRYSQLFLSTSWESLFAWGSALMGFRGGVGLDISQWFSQWVTAGFGYFGSLIALLSLVGRFTKFQPLGSAWHPVVALVSLQIPSLKWTQNLAKNDFGLIFWGLSAFVLSFHLYAVSPFVAFVAGTAVGAMVVGKFTLIFFGGILSLYVLSKHRKNLTPFILGGLVGSFPVFLRNFILTGNPVFPWLPEVFPSQYLNSFAEHGAKAATQKKFLFSDVLTYLTEFKVEIPFILILLVVIVLFRKHRKSVLTYLFVPVSAAIAFTLTVRPSTGIRYQNVVLVLLSVFSIFWVFTLVEISIGKFQRKILAPIMIILSVAFVSTADLTLFTLFQIGNPDKFNTFTVKMKITNQIGGPAKVWIRSNIRPEETIISYGDVHIYYLIDYALTEVGQSVEWGTKVFGKNLDDAELFFKTAPFDYLYLAGDDYYKDASFSKDQTQISEIMTRTRNWDSRCKMYDDEKAQVWNLKCLKGI
jgi:hypothetical protein